MTFIILFILGLSVGSFLNVLVDRIPSGESIWKGRSHCDYCHHKLSWYDLIPLISILMLRRKCRWCHKKLSWQYPLVEFITGTLFIFTYSMMIRIIEPLNSLLMFMYYLIIVSGLITIFFTDLKYRIIPDRILILLSIVTVIYLFFVKQSTLGDHLSAALIFCAFFFMLVILTKGRGMGLGDVKYAFVMGLILGISYAIVSFYLSFLTGAVISVILVIVGKKKMKSTIPFGPFLTVSTAISLFYGDFLWNIFKKIVGI